MKRSPSFFQGVTVAALFALAGTISWFGLSSVLGGRTALTLTVIVLGGAYVGYLLRGSKERTGRIATFSAWLLVTLAAYAVSPAVMMTVCIQALLISLVRSLYHHAAILAGMADLVLSGFALCAAVWASAQSGSMLLALWSFFLVQALFTMIPRTLNPPARPPEEDPFSRAYRMAQAAVKRAATQRPLPNVSNKRM